MRIVTANELQDWLSQGTVLEEDSHGPKVIRLPQGNLLKIFRSRSPLLARLNPEARRFAKHASELQARGVFTPEIIEHCWIDRSEAVSACLYRPLDGISLDHLFRDQRQVFDALLPRLAAYIHQLHQRGIYFRSLHLGNILLTPNGSFGLIDFLDTRFKRHPLSKMLVKRNFRHLHNYLQRRKITDFPWDELMAHYSRASRPGSTA